MATLNRRGGRLLFAVAERAVSNPRALKFQQGGFPGVELYEPAALTMIAGAGTPLAEIQKTLAENGQHLAFDPPDYSGVFSAKGPSTIGGIVATNASGPSRVTAGACRDALLGLRMVTGEGEIIKAGGRVMKNVTGYDLTKLVAGAYGTLGVITEVALKTLPAPNSTGVILIEGLDPSAAVDAMSRALRSPFDVNGVAHTTKGVDDVPVTMIRVQGFDASVAYRLGQLETLLAPFGDLARETEPMKTSAGLALVARSGRAA